VGRRRPDRDVHELGSVHRLRDVEREQALAVAGEELVEARLVDRHLAAPERVDPRRDHVPHGHAMTELREACARDEPHVARAEDGDALPLVGHVAR
jgi:hypothetical protein